MHQLLDGLLDRPGESPPRPRSSHPRFRRRPVAAGAGRARGPARPPRRRPERMGGGAEDLGRERRIGDVEAVEPPGRCAGADPVDDERLVDACSRPRSARRARPPARSGSLPADAPAAAGAPPRGPRRRRGGSGCRCRSATAAYAPRSPLDRRAVDRDPGPRRQRLACSMSRIRCRARAPSSAAPPHWRSRNWRSSCRKAGSVGRNSR